jgi:3-oxoadipate enol-lactonase
MYTKPSFLKLPDGQLYYEKLGFGDPIIFIHADSLDCRMWNEQFKYFSKKYTVIRFDLRGFGKSSLPNIQKYSLQDDLHTLIQKLNIQKPHLVGLSLGGNVAINYYLEHPEKVRSLVLADSGLSGLKYSNRFYQDINSVAKLAKHKKLDEAKKMWLTLPFFKYSMNNPKISEFIKQMVADSSGYRWYGKTQPLQKYPNSAKMLDKIKVPALILYGEYDIPDFISVSKYLHENIPNNKLVEIPLAGHLSNLDNPVEFNKEMERFLDAEINSS